MRGLGLGWAERPEIQELDEETSEHYLVFTVDDSQYAISVWHVLEVQLDVPAQPLLEKKSLVGFSVPFRGLRIPGVDWSHVVGGAPSSARQAIVLDVEEQPVAVLIDRVLRLVEVTPEKILSIPGWLRRNAGTWVLGALEGPAGRLVLVLDASRLFDRREIEALKAFQ